MRGLGRRLAVGLLFLATSLVMFAWMMPFVSAWTLGNDYLIYSPGAQIDLMWSVWKGTFPLYMPGFAGGHSTAAMTLGQLYHPISWLSSLMPGYWGEHALEWTTLYRILSLGVAHLALFRLCRRLRVGPLPAFMLTFPVVYNQRMLDSFRYGASLDGYCAMLFVAVAGGFVYLEHRKRRPVFLLGFCTYLLVVSGHPQWAFLGLLGAGLFTLLFPWIARAIDPSRPRLERPWLGLFAARISLGFATGLLLAAPYLLTFYFEYFRTNHARVGNEYSWTLECADSFRGQMSSFMFPLHADVHGAFAGSALFLVAALFPLAAAAKRPPRVLWLVYSIATVAFLFALGKETWVHPFMVRYLPLFGAFRVPGRLTLWIPLMLLPLLAWMLRPDNRSALFAAATGALVLLGMSWLWTTNTLPATEAFSPHAILGHNIPRFMDSLLLAQFTGTALFLAGAARYRGARRPLLVVAGGLMIWSTWFCILDGTWRHRAIAMPTFEQLAASRRASAASQADPGYGMEMRSVTEYRAHNLTPERRLGTIAHRAARLDPAAEVLEVLQKKGSRTPLPLFIDRPVAALSPETTGDHDEVKLVYNTSNRFVFDVVAARDGYFVLGLPALPGFRSRVDGVATEIVKADALFPATFISRGAHRVELYFVSWPFFAGVSLCFLTIWSWIFVSVRRRRLVALAALVSAAALGGALCVALFHGPSFETGYQWQGQLDPGASVR